MYTLLYTVWCTMKFRRVLAAPYSNYSLLCILLLDIFCSTIRNLVEHIILFPVVILCCILSIRYCISYDFNEVLYIKLPIVEYNYVYCKKCWWLYQLLHSFKYFLWDIIHNIECCWALTVLYYNGYVFRKSIFWENRSDNPYKLVYTWVSVSPTA